MRRWLLLLWWAASAATSIAQDVKVNGRFTANTVKLGERIAYTLSARHPEKTTVLFPDSTYNFAPFEYHQKHFLPTVTKDGVSYDSAVYILTTFDISAIQGLKLPVYVVQPLDCVTVFAAPDSVAFGSMVSEVPDSVTVAQLPLRTNTAWQKVRMAFNYPLAGLVLGIALVLLVVIYLIFGKRIRAWITRRRMLRRFEKYRETFSRNLEELKTSFSETRAEQLLVLWKSYMESLEGTPYTKYTSKEILAVSPDAGLARALQRIDRAIYGRESSEVYASFHELRSKSEDRLYQQLEQLNKPS